MSRVYVPVAEVQIPQLPAGSGYFNGSDEFYEQIGAVEAVPDRMIIFQGSLSIRGPFRRHAVDRRPASGPADR